MTTVCVGEEWLVDATEVCYRKEDFAVNTRPRRSCCRQTFMIDCLGLSTYDDGTVREIIGLFPDPQRVDHTRLSVPESFKARLGVINSAKDADGLEKSLPVDLCDLHTFASDHETHWCVVNAAPIRPESVVIEFLPGALAVIERKAIVSLWFNLPPCTAPNAPVDVK